MKKISGAKIVIETLIQEKVDIIFGYPGGAVLPIYDELFKQKKITQQGIIFKVPTFLIYNPLHLKTLVLFLLLLYY